MSPVTVEVDERVAIVTMADTDGGNAISPALIEQVPAALASVAADPRVHVVLAAGLPNVFATGASREYLLTEERADVEPFVRAFPHCPLPVVAAMQGHAIGGGLSHGLYADVPVLSERSVYAANFLNYALVPEYGTTWLLPSRLGHTLGAEMLLTARGYRGAELRARSAPVRVVPHDEVFGSSLEIARDIARAPRHALRLLKEQLAAQALAAGDAAIEVEVGRHEQAWRSEEFRRLVEQRYGRAEEIAR
ncbi:polyketide biosynthesis enoyl-CoA hydratase PksI [Saccharopolyspora erythraea NRRL 2338]|uniref:Polyketide biosynthesis enoyl-CoA hydratase n=2 Tax=Saccharopolyspora erythraea TaxID=1836 RepID=A4FIG6_SACEN|nr:polyketide synthase [Saccharopolyspora erythraea]EQD87912.1 crotonase [Saccharopolyspora erythraea D]PFG97517.1 polyketide biosynthesis enoyl-CoA hydratase PksI [Saccharopolyspora erythraea NRRL 2338]QRK87692.1 enoyl-CoA hydratase/isomerase family protein [Saccharopolyspora erythraea]CAM03841.1 polyketide biosynthesis enoyl-CoA hydratase [Saccharopolyspora erythraea NRRL 2338]